MSKLKSAQSMKALTERVIKADLASRNHMRINRQARMLVTTGLSTAVFFYAMVVIGYYKLANYFAERSYEKSLFTMWRWLCFIFSILW
jgi:hypothetical protein